MMKIEEIGIIGAGDMGRLYASRLADAGYRVNVCDLPEKREETEEWAAGQENRNKIHVLDNGRLVSRRSDLIIYSVETDNIHNAAEQYADSTRKGAIVGGQTSVKTPEIEAFEKYLPSDASIVTFHSLHGPSVNPEGQNLIAIRHRTKDDEYESALEAIEKIGSRIIEVSDYREHDKGTADAQAVTYTGFLSMGTAWMKAGIYPWDNPSYKDGLDNIKIAMMLRIYSGKSHVYSGLAIMNPYAGEQISQYSKSVTELFRMIIQGNGREFRERISKAKEFLGNSHERRILRGRFITKRTDPISYVYPNSHLSLLAMADSWTQLKANPYDNIYRTPPFMLRLGIVDYLFNDDDLLAESVNTALRNKKIRGHDLGFQNAVDEWAAVVGHGDMKGYKEKFETTKKFFSERIPDGMKASNEMIAELTRMMK